MTKTMGENPKVAVRDNALQEEAISALLAHGFQKNQVLMAIQQVYKANPKVDQVESLIKLTLKQLST